MQSLAFGEFEYTLLQYLVAYVVSSLSFGTEPKPFSKEHCFRPLFHTTSVIDLILG